MQTISFIIFRDFSMFRQIFLSRQVKRWAIITYKHCIYELPHELPNDSRLEKQKINFSRCALFHMKTKVSPKYFVSYRRLTRICRIQLRAQFFCLRSETNPLGTFAPKIQNCQFNLKLEYVEIIGGAHFYRVWLEIHFLGKFRPKNQNCQFKLKFGT